MSAAISFVVRALFGAGIAAARAERRRITPATPPPGRPPGGPGVTQIRPERASCEALRGALWHDQIGVAAPELMVISASSAG
jgi:hypothetical protein